VVDRELYLPRVWADDPARCQAVGVPEQVGFAIKPALAQTMICRALDAGMPAAWVTGDEVYGNSPGLRAELEARGVGHVLAVARDHRVRFGGTTGRVDELLTPVPARAWQLVSAGAGAKGHRLYDWASVRLDHDGPPPVGQAGRHWLLVRRNRTTGELAFYRCYTLRPTPWPSWSKSPAGAGRWRCVNHSALIYADWLHDLGSRCGLAVLSRSSAGGCTSQAGGIGAGGARRVGGGRRG
jgi:hypothetical protein